MGKFQGMNPSPQVFPVTWLPCIVTREALVTRMPSKLAFATVNPVMRTWLRPALSRPSTYTPFASPVASMMVLADLVARATLPSVLSLRFRLFDSSASDYNPEHFLGRAFSHVFFSLRTSALAANATLCVSFGVLDFRTAFLQVSHHAPGADLGSTGLKMPLPCFPRWWAEQSSDLT